MTIRLALLAALLGCCASLLPAQAPQANPGISSGQDPNEPDILRGLVLNSVTHEHVARVLVYSPDNRFATLTDDRGRFQFTFAPASETLATPGQPVASTRPYELSLRKPGFLSHDGDQRFPLDPSQHDIILTIVPESLIVGRVSLPPGAGQATVEVFRRQVSEGRERWQTAGAVTARSSGEFRFADLPAGDYKVFTHEITENDPLTFDPAKQFGFPPVYFPASSDFSSAAVIELSAGQNFQASLAPVRRPYYPVKVQVLNAPMNGGGEPEVYPQGHPGPGYSLGYNFNDQMIQGALPEGVYTVQLSSYGPAALSGEVNLTVAPGAAVAALMMLPNPSLTVRVKNEMQQSYGYGFGQSEQRSDAPSPPPSPAQEYLRYFQLQLLGDGVFGNDQVYQAHPPNEPQADHLIIEGIRPGRYRVRVNSTIGYVVSVASGDTDLFHQPLLVPAGASLPALEVKLRDDGAEVDAEVQIPSASSPVFATPLGGRPFGSVSRFSNQSPGFVYFVPASDGAGQFRQFWINSNGTVNAQQIPPGEYRVLAFAKQHADLELASEESLRKFDAQSQRLTLSAGQKQKVRLSLIAEEQP